MAIEIKLTGRARKIVTKKLENSENEQIAVITEFERFT